MHKCFVAFSNANTRALHEWGSEQRRSWSHHLWPEGLGRPFQARIANQNSKFLRNSIRAGSRETHVPLSPLPGEPQNLWMLGVLRLETREEGRTDCIYVFQGLQSKEPHPG